jgi:hypothetical protein
VPRRERWSQAFDADDSISCGDLVVGKPLIQDENFKHLDGDQ